jgi:hypothetical protein
MVHPQLIGSLVSALEVHFAFAFVSVAFTGLTVPVSAKSITDNSAHHQDGSGDHHPMGILHYREHASLPFASGDRISTSAE